MSEPLPPCPVCGGAARPGIHTGDFPYCRACHFSAAPNAWRRLAAAVALAGAVERLEAWLLYDSMRWIDLSKRATGIVRARKRLAPRTRPDVAMVEGTLAAALVALADAPPLPSQEGVS